MPLHKQEHPALRNAGVLEKDQVARLDQVPDSRQAATLQVIRLELHTHEHGRYSITFEDETLVSRVRDPEHDAARELLTRGIRGKAETIDAVTGTPRLRFDIEAFAGTCVEETSERGLRVRQWRGDRFQKAPPGGGVLLKDAPSGEGGTGHPAELPRVLEPVVRAGRQGGAA